MWCHGTRLAGTHTHHLAQVAFTVLVSLLYSVHVACSLHVIFLFLSQDKDVLLLISRSYCACVCVCVSICEELFCVCMCSYV